MLERQLDLAHLKMESGDDDLVDALLGICGKWNGFTRDHVKVVLLNAFLGGLDTSYLTVLWMMFELVWMPQALKKDQDKIRATVAAGSERRVQPSNLSKITYLNMIVMEAL
ncbi:4-hydroxyphenylacetaldehyde oxime monooxygenase [Hordeum vulgare]|nr:4-hydroxyphenylacetaldehyde oxime monooxygenase [Hordeum vulgare]KAI4990698.1 hypothetical protein ZWY2020_039069 [Hordeum vulgare]